MRQAFDRRRFLQGAGAVATLGLADAAERKVAIVYMPEDRDTAGAWAVSELQGALAGRRIPVRLCERVSEAEAGELCILAALGQSPLAKQILRESGAALPEGAETVGVVSGRVENRPLLLACGGGSRGLVYAVLELADRVRHATDPLAALAVSAPLVEQPSNPIRAVSRLFTSDVEDKPWFNDREMWPQYLTMLATQRFNRFHLALGIGYDFLRNVTDAYFLFPYPFLMAVPGYNVRVPELPDAERDRNLEMLRYISEQVVARGMDFQLGLWMHGYEWIDSPKPNYTIAGLTRETHGLYCRDAVRALLKALPAVTGVTFRIHGESGVEEGSYEFWKAIFDGVATCGRRIEIDMHAKGMDQTMLDLAVNTGLPVKVSPKYWAEHLGMPYHQADIRELEQPRPERQATGLMKLSAGSRSFLRYGYGDLLREDRKWDVLHRIWPGTQRVLLWGDPVTAAAHSRAFRFCGSVGVDIMEPLSFKGRRGSGIAGDRCAYADASLRPRWDWEKYVYGHRVWGRLLYNPEADPDTWRRYLVSRYGPGASAMEKALGNASRILPIVTTAHGASAGNNTYWPEVYLNHSMVDGDHPGPYRDSPVPRVFGNVSPLDPQLFSRINDFAHDLLGGGHSGKYSPIEVAQWLEDHAATAAQELAAAKSRVQGKDRADFRRFAIDVEIQSGLGRFFAAKFRSGVLYRIYEKSHDRAALEACLHQYRAARAAWSGLASRAKGIYVPDITVGENPQLRGHWLDRLPAMDADIATIAAKLESAADGASQPKVAAAIRDALGHPQARALDCKHAQPARFRRGQPIQLSLAVEGKPSSVVLYYRHVNQAERFSHLGMEESAGEYQGSIPAPYTESPYPLEYYFEVKFESRAYLYPGLGAQRTSQPYFVLRT
jgi:hypothetical protein